MPWKATDVMNLRTEFVLRALREKEPFGELCREYGISRKTGYKWKQRFLEQGLDGLADHSRRPQSSPSETDEDMVCRIVQLKLAHPSWGPAKLLEIMRRAGQTDLPSESTFKRILGKAGLVERRRRRKPCEQGRITNRIEAERPNHVWTIDFKGWWRTRDRSRFEPLTIRDQFSRYVLCAQAMADAKSDTVRAQMARVFERHGLPEVIRSDNGSPFAATSAPLGLSRLSAWWLTLGIDLDRIPPRRPDQNGGHERMHRDIAMELENKAEIDGKTQQASLDAWRKTFNEERPHAAIGMRVPADLYTTSTRRYDGSHAELAYPTGQFVRKVRRKGAIKIWNHEVQLSASLQGYDVGLEVLDGDRLAVWFCRLRLGEIDLRTRKFHAATGG